MWRPCPVGLWRPDPHRRPCATKRAPSFATYEVDETQWEREELLSPMNHWIIILSWHNRHNTAYLAPIPFPPSLYYDATL